MIPGILFYAGYKVDVLQNTAAVAQVAQARVSFVVFSVLPTPSPSFVATSP